MGKILTKEIIRKTKSIAMTFYDANREIFVDNPDFERCVKLGRNEESKDWKCNTCEYKEGCGKGEKFWEENPKVVEETIDTILKMLKEREENLIKNSLNKRRER